MLSDESFLLHCSMPKAIAAIDISTDICFIDRMTHENVVLISEFVVEDAGLVHFVQCDQCGKRIRLMKTAKPSNIIIHRSSKACNQHMRDSESIAMVDPPPAISRQPSMQGSLVSELISLFVT